MTYRNPFPLPGRWFRGNTHTHTTISDGQATPAERCAAYREAGYDFLVLTDHGQVSDVSSFCDDTFLAISGSELHPPNPYGGDIYHFVAIGIHTPVETANRHPNAVLADVQAQGGLAVICHPYWSGHSLLDYLVLHGYFAVEVYNDTCVRLIGKGNSEETWDQLLDRVGPTLGIASDDAHCVEEDCFHGWIMVKAAALTETAILEALRTGAFYATTGPEFHDLQIREETITNEQGTPEVQRVLSLTCSPAATIAIKCQRSYGWYMKAQNGVPLCEAEYVIPAGMKYIRVELTDAQGKKAWSNPFCF